MERKERNILGYSSIIAAVISVVFFFLPINLELDIAIIGFLSLLGIGFAIFSKELRFVFIGIILNSIMLGMAYLLLIGADFMQL